MTDATTPGEIAYAAYCAALQLGFPRQWADVSLTMQAAWEAAAQAVLAMKEEEEDGCTTPTA